MLKTTKDDDLLEHLYECSTICILDEFFSIAFSNNNFNTLIGYNENELNGSSLLQITHHDQSNSVYNFLIETLEKGDTWKGELQFTHKKSQLVWLDTIIKPIVSKSKHVRYLANFIDISHQKQLTDNVKQRAHRQCLIAILGQISLNNIPIQDLIEQTLSVVCGSLNTNSGIILEIKDYDSSAIVRAGYNTNHIISEETIIPIKLNDVLNHTIHSNQPINCNDLTNEKRFIIPNKILKENATSGIFFLIGDKKSPFGIFILLSNKSKTLNIDETYFLQSICNIIAESNSRHLMEQNLRHERELSRSYLDVAEVVFVVVDINKNIVLINHHASKITGYTQEDLKGTDFIEKLIPETHIKSSIINFNNKINKTHVTNEMEINTHSYGNVTPIITKQKTMRYIRWRSSSLLDDNENVEYILYAGEDITEILKRELEEKNLQKILHQAQKTEAIGLLAGSIAHDFNNILASILGFSELALDNIKDSDKKLIKYLNKIQESGIKGRNIIDQMQHLNLQEDTPNNTILLPSLLKSTLQMLHSILPSSINIQTDINNDIPAVKINAPKFNQMIMHLLSNSNTALNGKGSIKISMNKNKIHNQICSSCGESINDQYVILTIHDNGPGINKSLLNNIFSYDKNEFNSGLIFVSKISHEKQGHLVINNKKLNINDTNEGTCIELLFKIVNYESENEQHDKDSIDFSKIHHKNIMIVDDESTVASYMGELFNGAGFLSHVFSDPVQAFNEFEMSPEKFDLIISDLTMPAITGDILASKMLKINPKLPIIICTGHEDLLSKEKANDLQIQALFKKPVDSTELLHTVVSLLTK